MFFPRDTFWGYGQFDLAPPHNEIDPNICRADAGISGGVNDPCNAFARYMISGYIEAHPFGRGQFRRFFLFGEPRFLFGKNLPQTLYTWSMAAIGLENSWGGGLYLGKGFEMRVTQHFLFTRSGARDQHLGGADLGRLASSVLTHRLLPSVEAAMGGRTTTSILDSILRSVPVPEGTRA